MMSNDYDVFPSFKHYIYTIEVRMEHALSESDKNWKNKKRYEEFFGICNSLTVDQINEPTRKWHCPACHGRRGASRWCCNLQALVAHTKTKSDERVKIHRELAESLEKFMRLKGATINPAGKSHGQWKGLNEVVKDRDIVWPPMVIIRNTRLKQDESQKWLGMGNQELLDYFKSYGAVKARHSYGPKGHMGISVLIFEESPVGYIKAEQLKKDFEDEGRDRAAWDLNPVLLDADGKQILYGYMATKEDMDIFDKHSRGKSKSTFELVSYQKKVVDHQKADLVAERLRQKDREKKLEEMNVI